MGSSFAVKFCLTVISLLHEVYYYIPTHLSISDVKYEIFNVHALPRYSMPKSKNGNVYSDKFTLSVVELTHIDITAASQIPRFLNYAKKQEEIRGDIAPKSRFPLSRSQTGGYFYFLLSTTCHRCNLCINSNKNSLFVCHCCIQRASPELFY